MRTSTSFVISAVLIFTLALLACSSLERQVQFRGPVTESDQITKRQALSDLKLLIEVMEEVSPWKYTIPEKFEQGMKYLRDLELDISASNVKSLLFCQQLAHFFTIVPDNHSYLTFKKEECGVPLNRSHYKGAVGLNSLKDKQTPFALEPIEIERRTGLLLSIVRFPVFQDPLWDSLKNEFKAKLARADFIVSRWTETQEAIFGGFDFI